MSSQPKTFITPELYLEMERQAEFKSEYYRGEVFAMAGAGRNHNKIIAHLIRALGNALSSRGCEVFPSDMRVHIPFSGLYTYPDVSVVCGQEEYLDEVFDTLLNPILIVEVLSPSTKSYDRGDKFALYRRLPSLREYLLVSSTEVLVESYSLATEGLWTLRETQQITDSISLPNLEMSLPLAELYANIEF